ncbi:MAG: efflux RND transporter periplasmic adaptor subunit [Bacteroidota bacterium]
MRSKYIIQFLAVLAIMTMVYACSPSQAAESTAVPPTQVGVEEIKQETFQEKVTASGRLSSTEEANLSFKLGGVVNKILVREGQKVRKGQLLGVLALEEINAQVASAKLGNEKAAIDLENAKLALQLAERDFRNTKALYEDSVATLEQFENVEVQLQNAKNQKQAAETALSLSKQNQSVADFNLKYAKIVAPANGTILRRMAEPNEIVGVGKPIFLFGSTDKALVVKVNVTDKEIVHLQLGDPATIKFDAYAGTTFSGKIRELAGRADPFTGTYEVEVQVNPEGKKLLSGFIGEVEILGQTKREVFPVDAAALISADGSEGKIFVVKGNQVEQRTIQIYQIKAGNMLVESGIKAGDQVVVTGAGYLEDGQQIVVVR